MLLCAAQGAPLRYGNQVVCGKCGEPYPLPEGAASFRCKRCGHFNNFRDDCCVIL
jgi:LSD1 subclass zinc finger protein